MLDFHKQQEIKLDIYHFIFNYFHPEVKLTIERKTYHKPNPTSCNRDKYKDSLRASQVQQRKTRQQFYSARKYEIKTFPLFFKCERKIRQEMQISKRHVRLSMMQSLHLPS